MAITYKAKTGQPAKPEEAPAAPAEKPAKPKRSNNQAVNAVAPPFSLDEPGHKVRYVHLMFIFKSAQSSIKSRIPYDVPRPDGKDREGVFWYSENIKPYTESGLTGKAWRYQQWNRNWQRRVKKRTKAVTPKGGYEKGFADAEPANEQIPGKKKPPKKA